MFLLTKVGLCHFCPSITVILGMNWETYLSYSAKKICLQSSLLSSLLWKKNSGELNLLGESEGVKDKLLKQLLPSELWITSLPKHGVKCWQYCHFTPNSELPEWVPELPEVKNQFMGGDSDLPAASSSYSSFSFSQWNEISLLIVLHQMLSNPPEFFLLPRRKGISLDPPWSQEEPGVSPFALIFKQ